MGLRIKVETYSGYKADESPLRFSFLKPQAPSREITRILDQWYGVGYQCFKVLADDNHVYILKHNSEKESWTLESFRSARR